MLTYVKESDLLSIQVQALSAADKPLKAMYECFMENNGDLLRRADTALSYAIYIVGVNRPILKDVATLKVTFYVLLFGLSLFLVRVDFGQSLHVVDKWYLWGNLIALAIFPTAISFLCTTQAVQYIGSTPTAILGALEPVTAVFFGVTIFGESLTPRLCCGIVLIILAVTFIIAGSNITTHLVRFRKLFPRLPLKHIKK